MARQSSVFYKQLFGHLNNNEHTRKRMESLYSQRKIVERDINILYSGLFLDVITKFENMIEILFIDLLVGKTKHLSKKVQTKITFPSIAICRDIIYGTKSYLDWFPYDITVRRSNIYFKNGIPFNALESSDKKILQEILYIRNVLAHKSKHSLKMFEKEVIKDKVLLQKEKTPTGYLRRPFALFPPQTQYEVYISEIARIAYILCY
ncbi:MAG: hypothetical protein A2W74_09405 [Planctomycetes bacterium RIFCSPLOWO2_12_38_17]|nr:MAG: hypothetical protein A2W74_09405 [Planctomycetes bacterium RIFCSPLOWO2_12_38_17]